MDETESHEFLKYKESSDQLNRNVEEGNCFLSLLPNGETGKLILEGGCGPGDLAADLAARNPDSEIIAVDMSETFLEEATNHYKQLENLSFEKQDLNTLEGVKDGSVDFYLSHHATICYSPNLQATFNNLARVMKPNSKMVIRASSYTKSDGLDFPDNFLVPVVLTENLVSMDCAFTSKQIKDKVERAGFVVINIHESPSDVPLDYTRCSKDITFKNMILSARKE